jgi:hypothetical protein
MTADAFLYALPNARRIATARSALYAGIAVRGDCPMVSDEAVIELLTDLKHFCAARRIDFGACFRAADARFATEMNGGDR